MLPLLSTRKPFVMKEHYFCLIHRAPLPTKHKLSFNLFCALNHMTRKDKLSNLSVNVHSQPFQISANIQQPMIMFYPTYGFQHAPLHSDAIKHKAAVKLQKNYRGHLVRKRFVSWDVNPITKIANPALYTYGILFGSVFADFLIDILYELQSSIPHEWNILKLLIQHECQHVISDALLEVQMSAKNSHIDFDQLFEHEIRELVQETIQVFGP
jgi:hypothetical protein